MNISGLGKSNMHHSGNEMARREDTTPRQVEGIAAQIKIDYSPTDVARSGRAACRREGWGKTGKETGGKK